MQIHMKGRKIEVTEALETFTKEKLDKLERHFDKIKSINVVFGVEKLKQKAEATVQIAKGELFASSESDDMYASVDTLINKLDRQLIKHKEKLNDHR